MIVELGHFATIAALTMALVAVAGYLSAAKAAWDALDAILDAYRLGLLHCQDRPWQLLGVLRTRLRWRLVPGSGGKRLVHALVGGNGPGPLPGDNRKMRRLQELDGIPRHRHFSLHLLGACIVRSSIITSVHAFAADPERGT